MAAPTSGDYEMLTEHFGYPLVALLDDVINTVNVLADRALDSVERLLLSIPPAKLGFITAADDTTNAADAARLEIENGTHQLETLLNASIDKNFDIFELYAMNNFFTIKPEHRPYMRLAHYEGLDFSSTSASNQPDRPTTESVTALRRRVHASQRLHVSLEQERVRNEALLRRLRKLVGVDGAGVKKEGSADEASQPGAFAFLRDKGSLEQGGTERPITTTTEFALSQLQALRALSTSLRNILPDLAEPHTDSATAPDQSSFSSAGKKSWRRERVEYVEGASRKYLQDAGGMELGAQGEVRDGEWQGEGRRLTRAEVEGLEKVVAILGSNEGGEGSSENPSTHVGGHHQAMDDS